MTIRFKSLDTCCAYLAKQGYRPSYNGNRFFWAKGGSAIEIAYNVETGVFFFRMPA